MKIQIHKNEYWMGGCGPRMCLNYNHVLARSYYARMCVNVSICQRAHVYIVVHYNHHHPHSKLIFKMITHGHSKMVTDSPRWSKMLKMLR